MNAESAKKREKNIILLRRDSEGFDVYKDEEYGFVFRHKRQRLPTAKKSGKKSVQKSKSTLPIADILIEALSPIIQSLIEEFSSEHSNQPELQATLNAFAEKLLTPAAVLQLAKIPQTTISDCNNPMEMMRSVCSPGIVAFVEATKDGIHADLRAKLMQMAPKDSATSIRIEELSKKVKLLKMEEKKWEEIIKDDLPLPLTLPPLVHDQETEPPPLLTDIDRQTISDNKHQLILQSLELQQSISVVEELVSEAERLFKELQRSYNQQEIGDMLVSNDPRIILRNLLTQ